VRDRHLAGGLDRNFLAMSLCMVFTLGREGVVGYRCWRSNMRSCNIEELSISICFSFRFSISFTLCQRMRVWMRRSKSQSRSMNLMLSDNMRIHRTPHNMTDYSTVSLSGNMSVSTVLSDDILALLYIGGVHHSPVLGGALLLLVALLLCVCCALLLRHLLHHSVALWDSVCSTLLLMLGNIVGNMFCVTHSIRYSVALLACHYLIGNVTPRNIVTIAITTTSTMSIIMTIAWVTFWFGLCFS